MMDENVPIKKFRWMDLCIKCDKSDGKLLNCHDNACPVVVHEDCLGCEAQFDELGNFSCPYCAYKRAFQEAVEAESKRALAEKNLSKYLGGKGVVETGNVSGRSGVRDQCAEVEKDVTGGECRVRDKGADVLFVGVGVGGVETVNVIGSSDFHDQCWEGEKDVTGSECIMRDEGADDVLLVDDDDFYRVKVVEKRNEGGINECCSEKGKVDREKDVDMNERSQSGDKIHNDATGIETFPEYHLDAGHYEAHDFMEENVEEAEENEGRMDEVKNQEQAHKSIEEIVCKDSVPQVHMEAKRKVNDTTASTCMDTDTISEEVTGAQQPGVNIPKGSSRKKVVKPPAVFQKSPTPNMKRKRSAWKVEEEDKLKKGVLKHSELVNKNIPWKKILEEGRDVFDETRTPADLKDKWRNILSKETLFELS